jgi:hypothetical protein
MFCGHLNLVHGCVPVIIDIAPATTADLLLVVIPIARLAKLVKNAKRFFIRPFRPACRYPFHHGLGIGYDASRQTGGLWGWLRGVQKPAAIIALLVHDFFREVN